MRSTAVRSAHSLVDTPRVWFGPIPRVSVGSARKRNGLSTWIHAAVQGLAAAGTRDGVHKFVLGRGVVVREWLDPPDLLGGEAVLVLWTGVQPDVVGGGSHNLDV